MGERSNPNNCASCRHKQNPDGGHCYMFRFEPTEMCAQHTSQIHALQQARALATRRLLLLPIKKHQRRLIGANAQVSFTMHLVTLKSQNTVADLVDFYFKPQKAR